MWKAASKEVKTLVVKSGNLADAAVAMSSTRAAMLDVQRLPSGRELRLTHKNRSALSRCAAASSLIESLGLQEARGHAMPKAASSHFRQRSNFGA